MSFAEQLSLLVFLCVPPIAQDDGVESVEVSPRRVSGLLKLYHLLFGQLLLRNDFEDSSVQRSLDVVFVVVLLFDESRREGWVNAMVEVDVVVVLR